MDPLSSAAAAAQSPTAALTPDGNTMAYGTGSVDLSSRIDDSAMWAKRIGRNPGMLDRNTRRMQVLHKYTVKDDSPAMSSLLGNVGEETEFSEADRNRMRLGRLNALAEGESSLHGAQIELISIIERMDADLNEYWANGDRVRSLRIAIQAIKVLGHTRVPQCYPSMFVLAATVLDTFGDLVSDRIRDTAAQQSPLIAQLIAAGKEPDPAIIPPQAVEMCNNWFLKILSIRELLPRVYVELSLMRCYRYVAKKFRIESMRAVVERLAMQVRGVADPLVAAHARWYVCMRARDVLAPEDPHWGESMVLCVEDTLQLIANLPPRVYESKNLRRSAYVLLFTPPLQWLVDTVARHSTRDVAEQLLERVLKLMESNPAVCYSSIAAIISAAFEAELVVRRIPRLIALLGTTDYQMTYDVPRLNVIASLCHALAEVPPPLPFTKQEKMATINHLWEIVNADRSNLEGFLVASRGLLRLLAVHTATSQVNVLIGAVNDRLMDFESARETPAAGASPARGQSPTKPNEGGAFASPAGTPTHGGSGPDLPNLVHDLLWTLLVTVPGTAVFSMWPQVLPLLSYLSLDARDDFARRLLKSVPSSSRFSTTVLDLCRQLHDRLSDDTPPELVKDTSDAVCRAIRQCFAADDVEQHLRFLCDCRHGLSQLDAVKITVVEEALRLVPHIVAPQQAGKKVKRSAAKGCFAFAHVTAPGINDAIRRLHTCVQAAGVAFQHGFVGQAEVLLQLAVAGLGDVKAIEQRRDGSARNNDIPLARVAVNIMSLGAAAPPHAKYGPLYALRAVVDWATEFAWPEKSDSRWRIASAAISLVAALRAGTLPYGFKKCPLPTATRQHPAFEPAALGVLTVATASLSSEMTRTGHAVLAAVECSIDLFKADPNTGRLLQRALRTLVEGSAPGEAYDVDYLRSKLAVMDKTEKRLGTEHWNALIDGPEIPALQAATTAAAQDDEDDDGVEENVATTTAEA